MILIPTFENGSVIELTTDLHLTQVAAVSTQVMFKTQVWIGKESYLRLGD